MNRIRDVVIVGSGAGGSPLALRLSQAGFDVLVLERGPRYTRDDYKHDELLIASHRGFFVPSVDSDPHVIVDHGQPGERPKLGALGWIARCVGGGTSHMAGSFYRFHPDDFRLRALLGPFENIVDWPYAYEELEPYYSMAEWEIGVSGAAGTNPFEGMRSRPYPLPPLDSHPLALFFDGACRRLRLHPFPTPRAINSRPYGGRPACAYCAFCVGFGCLNGARGGAQDALLPRAERTGRCEIRPNAMVQEVTIDTSGRVTGCIYIDEAGVEHRVRARIICICCSAVESARLLLMSKSKQFPAGLANGSGLLGRNLQFHAGSTGRAQFRHDRHADKGLTNSNCLLGRSVMDYYFLPRSDLGWPKGGLLRFDLVRVHPIGTAQRIARDASGRWLWGPALKRRLWEYFREAREVEFEVFQDFVPNADTYVELDPDVRDKWGLPVARIHLCEPDHHRQAGQLLVRWGLEILEAMDADQLTACGVGYTVETMVHGTCRAARDPVTSVLNEFCQAHEVSNLFVVDGSFMPTSGGAPSTLTIMANSFRTAEYIIDRARTGELAS